MPKNIEVPFFDYKNFFTPKKDDYLEIIEDVLSRGAFILQKDLADFERNFAEFMDIKHAIGVSDATSGLTLGLQALGVGPEDEVIFPSHTFIATAGAIASVGAIPVPADIGDDGLMSPSSVKDKITNKTKAIMPVQLNGRICDMRKIQEIADEFDLMLVEDSAQAFGARYGGKFAGSFGEFGVFSFYPAKSLGCFGDGGAIVTNDDDLARKMAQMRDHGRCEEHGIAMWGMNSRLDNLQAAILDYKLKSFHEDILRRRNIAQKYHSAFREIDDLILPPSPDEDPDRFDTYQNYEIRAGRRSELREFLSRNGVSTIIQWGGKAVHQFEKLDFGVSLPATEEYFEKCLLLPMNTLLSDEQVAHVCNVTRKFYGLTA
jgi:dTDP-4-amino-4,6-dideoxygalactose transaminase